MTMDCLPDLRNFNPRSPEGATRHGGLVPIDQHISIHAPRRERRVGAGPCGVRRLHFNPRSPEGATLDLLRSWYLWLFFFKLFHIYFLETPRVRGIVSGTLLS